MKPKNLEVEEGTEASSERGGMSERLVSSKIFHNLRVIWILRNFRNPKNPSNDLFYNHYNPTENYGLQSLPNITKRIIIGL